jgi:hypothetical protein
MNEVVERIRQWEAAGEVFRGRLMGLIQHTVQEMKQCHPKEGSNWGPYACTVARANMEDTAELAMFKRLSAELAVDCQRAGLDCSPLLIEPADMRLGVDVKQLLAKLEAVVTRPTDAPDEPFQVATPSLWNQYFGYRKQFTRWLETIPTSVIRRQGEGKGLSVHPGDWVKYWAERDQLEDEALGDPLSDGDVRAVAKAERAAKDEKQRESRRPT